MPPPRAGRRGGSRGSELAGGKGFTFEGSAAAFYLTALLDESYAPGIDNRIVARVLMQQRDLDEPLDDVVVGLPIRAALLRG